MPSSSKQPQSRADPATAKEQILRSNQTLNSILGGRRPSWLTSGQQNASAPANEFAKAQNPRKQRRRSPRADKDHVPSSMPPSISTSTASSTVTMTTTTPVAGDPSANRKRAPTSQALEDQQPLMDAPRTHNVLPSPAPTDEPSPAVSTYQGSPRLMTSNHGEVTSRRNSPVAREPEQEATIQSLDMTPWVDQTATTGRRPPIALASALEPDSAPVFVATSEVTQSPVPVQSQQPPFTSSSFEPRELRETGQPTLGTRQDLEQYVTDDRRRAKRPRLNTQAGFMNPPGTADSISLDAITIFSSLWHTTLVQRMEQCAGPGVSREGLEWPRLELLREACRKKDLFYVVLHQVFCLWSSNRQVLEGTFNLESIELQRAFALLTTILRPNDEIHPHHLDWFMQFPGTFPSSLQSFPFYRLMVFHMTPFLYKLAAHWQNILTEACDRQCPLMVQELQGVLECYSPALQSLLFTVSRRAIGIDDRFRNEFNSTFVLDQENETQILDSQTTAQNSEARRTEVRTKYIKLVRAIKQHIRQGNMGSGSNISPTLPSAITPRDMRLQPQALLPSSPLSTASGFSIEGAQEWPRIGDQAVSSPTFASFAPSNSTQPTQPTYYHPSYHPYLQLRQTAQPQSDMRRSSPARSSPTLATGPQPAVVRRQPQVLPQVATVPSNNVPSVVSSSIAPATSRRRHSTQYQSVRPDSQFSLTPQQLAQLRALDYPIPIPATQQQQQQQQQQQSTNQQASMIMPGSQSFHPLAAQRMPVPLVQQPHAQQSQTQQSLAPQLPLPLSQMQQTQYYQMQGQPMQVPQVQVQQAHAQQYASAARGTTAHRGFTIPENEYPYSPFGESSLHVGLHLVAVRSPRRTPAVLNSGRFYQYMSYFAIPPVKLEPQLKLHVLTFSVSRGNMEKLSTRTKAENGRPRCSYNEGSQRYRLRICMRQDDSIIKESDWVVTRTHWPKHIFFQCNEQHLDIRRKQHFHHDQPLELTDFLKEGENTVKISLPVVPSNMWRNHKYFAAVEVVETRGHDTIRAMVETSQWVSSENTKQKIKSRLQPPDSDDVIFADETLTLPMTDPFSSSMFTIPVRGIYCSHLDCFDLETWLRTRPSKPISEGDLSQDGDEPSMADAWKCPVCGLDARPNSLFVDEYFAEVRNEVVKLGDMRLRAIKVTKDGKWTRVQEAAEESDDDLPLASAKQMQQKATGMQVATAEVIEIRDDD